MPKHEHVAHKTGCEQEFVAALFLRNLPECDQLGSSRDHALCFKQEVAQVLYPRPRLISNRILACFMI